MPNKKRIFTVLSIDGGGVRGVIPARILKEIEARTGKPIAELFDMIGGTSTGAIIAGSLVAPDPKNPKKPQYSADDVLQMYHRLAPIIFPEKRFKLLRKLSGGGVYDPKPLENALEKTLGELQVKDALTHFLIPVTDIKHFEPVWITHIKGQKDASAENWSSMLLREAIRATTSAPTYFPAKYYETTPNPDMPNVKHRHALIDGSFFNGNTLRHMLAQARKVAPPDAEIVIVHIGTGGGPEKTLSPEEFNKMGAIGLISPANGNILLSMITSMSAIDAAHDMEEELKDSFFSFDTYIDSATDPDAPSTALDDAHVENLAKLEKLAERSLQQNAKDFDQLCAILETRQFAEEQHLESQKALKKLTELMQDAKTVKGLMRLYLKIVSFSNGLDDSAAPAPNDAEIRALTEKLTDHHKAEIDRLYRVILDQKQHQSKIINTIKEAGEDITSITKKIFVDPFKDNPPPPGNDNKTPPANDAAKRNKPPKL